MLKLIYKEKKSHKFQTEKIEYQFHDHESWKKSDAETTANALLSNNDFQMHC
jgi:hypothetical protein